MANNSRSDPSSSQSSGTEVSLDVLPLHSTNLLTVLDADGIIQYESPSIERIYGYEQDELVGEQVAEYFHPDDRQKVVTAFQAIVASDTETETVETVEYRHKQSDGTYMWVESVASANPTPNGNYVVNTRDISARKEREQRLETTNARLEEFSRIVSHDLQNPLRVAEGNLELLREECDSPRIDTISAAHDRLSAIIEDTLSLAREGQVVGEREPVELSDIATASWQMVTSGDATLHVEETEVVCADGGRLQHLFENLFRNAIDHGGEDVTIRVGLVGEDDGFYIADDGPGIAASEREDVFETGYSNSAQKSGLGLSIVRNIAEGHGWNITVTDSTDGGTRFEITDLESAVE